MPDQRDSRGRFAPGNAGGPGNPLAGKISKLRAALVAAVTEDDIREIARALIATAKGGDVRAVKELLDRTLGRPVEADLIERLEALEAALTAVEGELGGRGMKQRIERLQARLAALGTCPVCNDRGIEGIRIEHVGPGSHPDPIEPAGCHRCGRVGTVTVLQLDQTPIGRPPLPGEPGAPYAEC